MTFDEWYDDPATQDALPVKARDVTRAAYEAGARSRDYAALREELAVAEMNALRAALEAAARSLAVLSRFGTRNEADLASNMTDLIHMRGYAASRASVARSALANRPEVE